MYSDENQDKQNSEDEIEMEIKIENDESNNEEKDDLNLENAEIEEQQSDLATDVNLENFKPLIPDLVLDHLLESNGIDFADTETRKTIAALAQKFVADVSASAFQFHKIHQKAAMKDKRFAKEKKITLNTEDLQKALEEYGIDISRPSYFI